MTVIHIYSFSNSFLFYSTMVYHRILNIAAVIVQLLSLVQCFVTPWTAAGQASLSFTIPGACSSSCPLSRWCHPTISSFVIPASHPLSSPSPCAFNLSQNQGLFQWVGSSHKLAKVLEFSFSISPSNEYSGLNSFRNDWFDLHVVLGLTRIFPNTTFWKHQFFGA